MLDVLIEPICCTQERIRAGAVIIEFPRKVDGALLSFRRAVNQLTELSQIVNPRHTTMGCVECYYPMYIDVERCPHSRRSACSAVMHLRRAREQSAHRVGDYNYRTVAKVVTDTSCEVLSVVVDRSV